MKKFTKQEAGEIRRLLESNDVQIALTKLINAATIPDEIAVLTNLSIRFVRASEINNADDSQVMFNRAFRSFMDYVVPLIKSAYPGLVSWDEEQS